MTHAPREPEIESGYLSPTITGSRRLMGPNLMHPGLGAVLDVALDGSTPARNERLLKVWHERVSFLATALDWPEAESTQRVYPGGASLFVHAPIDQLMTATEVCESAWVFAEACEADTAAPRSDALPGSLLGFARNEARPELRAIWDEATHRELNVTFDETSVFVGTGAGSTGWSLNAIPDIGHIDWLAVRDIPIVLVTGSNGKTTVVRMVAAMARACGHVVGYTCTDGVWVNSVQVESGDFSGPAGARRVLQDPGVTLAVLECARGGMLRRGLAVQRASVAAIVTISPDHFGEYGVTDLATLAEVKLIVARAVTGTGTLVVNADVPVLMDATAVYPGRLRAVRVSECGNVGITPAELTLIPATLGGTARHNMVNATIALAVAAELGLGAEAKAELLQFGAKSEDNMGRLMLRTVGGVTIVIDYAHNPQSIAALIDATRAIPAQRRAITLGTGGDRDDVAMAAIATAAVDSGCIDLYIAKEMPKFLRGRQAGSISSALLATLKRLAVPAEAMQSAASDMDAARAALEWAHPGDLLLLAVHDQREDILALLERLAASSWRPGTSLPAS